MGEYLFFLFPTLLMMIVGMYRMLAWGRLVKTWHKSLGRVVGYYIRQGRWGQPQRLSFAQLQQVEMQHYFRKRSYSDRREGEHYFSAIIQYSYGNRLMELTQAIRQDETLPYAPNEELLVYIHPRDPLNVRLGDNTTQLWLPFTIFACGLVLSLVIFMWGLLHGWQ